MISRSYWLFILFENSFKSIFSETERMRIPKRKMLSKLREEIISFLIAKFKFQKDGIN